MSLFEMLPGWAMPIVIFVFICWGIRLWLNHRKAVKEFPASDYDPQGSPAPWAWAPSPSGLELDISNSDISSGLSLPSARSSLEWALSLTGYFLIGLGIWLFLQGLFTQPERFTSFIWVLVIMWLIGWFLLHSDTPVTAIQRTPDQLVIFTRYGLFFHHTFRFQAAKAKRYSFNGKLQRAAAMTTDQLNRLPDYYLFANRAFGFSKRFILRTNPSQATWIIGGLNQWLSLHRPA